MNRETHPLEYYRRKELDVFPRIPGMRELMNTDPNSTDNLAAKYPDAVFALMTANEILSGDRERNAIHQEAYFDILRGENVADVRSRYRTAMNKYLQQHSWDD